MNASVYPYSSWLARTMLVVLLSLPLPVRGEGEHTAEQSVRTWHPVAELTAAEQALVDLRTDTPRDPQVTYLPAERYPFAPPYSAEEMGYRAMEFSHSPRWSCNLFDVAGVQGGRTFKT